MGLMKMSPLKLVCTRKYVAGILIRIIKIYFSTFLADLYEIPAVGQKWVLQSLKLGRLATTKPYCPLKNKLFSNLRFTAIGLSPKDLKELYKTITFYGGTFRAVLDRTITYLICGSNKLPAYTRTLAEPSIAIVNPDWVSDCITNKTLLLPDPYHPRLMIEPKPIFKPVTTPAVVQQDTNKPISSIVGFDFEEDLVKTEVHKKDQEISQQPQQQQQPPPSIQIQIQQQQATQQQTTHQQQQSVQQQQPQQVLSSGPGQQPAQQRMMVVRNVGQNPQIMQQQLINQKIRAGLTPQGQMQVQQQMQMQQQQQKVVF